MDKKEEDKAVIIIGAGPSGLAAGWELSESGRPVLILEKEDGVGGLCRTFDFCGYKFDCGGHRFFTKQPEVQKFWEEILGEDFLIRKRLSRIYYRKKFFFYPIKFGDALKKLGLVESFIIGVSLLSTRIKRLWKDKAEVTFEDWVVNRFGLRLFNHFFRSYTEKVWGISVKELGADWAAQRMKSISLWQIVKSFFIKPKHGQVKSWIEQFYYPKYGPGMFYDKVAEKIKENGGKVELNKKIERIIHNGSTIEKVVIKDKDGAKKELRAEEFISSMPLNIMLSLLSPAPPQEIMHIVNKMRFRSFFDVCLIINKKDIFPDNWIYVHEPQVAFVRVQNFTNWSPFTSADKNKTHIGVEYICWDTDDLWEAGEQELIDLAKKELKQVGLVDDSELIEKGAVIKNSFAYPVYYLGYKEDLKKVFTYLSYFKNLQTIGRAGLYRYNNMDHSILTGFYAARNILGGGKYDVLEINADEEYHEIERKN